VGSAPESRLVLASASPRRRDLLALAGFRFEVTEPGVAELTAGEPGDVVVENARRKALAVAGRVGGATVLAADTDVVLGGEILGKPADREAARRSLERLAGRTHEVLSGVVVAGRGGEPAVELVRSEVAIAPLGEDLLDLYLDSGEWEGKAGGYAVQGLGSALIERVGGDLSNVIGLPLATAIAMLADAGVRTGRAQ
jgi:septum formation protein